MPHALSVPEMPDQAPYARHVLICTGAYCDPTGKAYYIYRLLAQKLGDLGEYANPMRVKRGVTPCLGVCYGGPLLVVYPEGIWYHHVDEAVLERIVEEHLRQGKPVEEYIFHQLAHNPACHPSHTYGADPSTAQPCGGAISTAVSVLPDCAESGGLPASTVPTAQGTASYPTAGAGTT